MERGECQSSHAWNLSVPKGSKLVHSVFDTGCYARDDHRFFALNRPISLRQSGPQTFALRFLFGMKALPHTKHEDSITFPRPQLPSVMCSWTWHCWQSVSRFSWELFSGFRSMWWT